MFVKHEFSCYHTTILSHIVLLTKGYKIQTIYNSLYLHIYITSFTPINIVFKNELDINRNNNIDYVSSLYLPDFCFQICNVYSLKNVFIYYYKTLYEVKIHLTQYN